MNDIDPTAMQPSVHLPETESHEPQKLKLGGERLGGEYLMDLDEITPLIDSEEFERQTGFRGALVAELSIGHDTYGIVDAREHTIGEGGQFNPEAPVWSDGKRVQTATSPILFVQLNKTEANNGDTTYVVPQGHDGFRCSKGIRATPSGLRVGRNSGPLIDRGFSFSKYVSGEHALITLTPDFKNLRITDTNSANGTQITLIEGATTEHHTAPNSEIIDSAQVRMLGGRILEADRSERLRSVDVGVAEIPLKGEDTVLTDTDLQLFGVFDGVGGGNEQGIGRGHGGEASAQTSRIIREAFSIGTKVGDSPESTLEILKTAFEHADSVPSRGRTTATVVKIHQSGDKRYAVWASAGDSRLYVYRRTSDRLTQITDDEIFSPERPNVITNAIGTGSLRLKQSGFFELADDDELMLCSDGITGDYAPDILSAEEIRSVLRTPEPAITTAWGLAQLARKRDDKSVIVVK